MKLTQFTVIVFFLTASVCRGKIVIETSKWEKSMARLADDLINIMTSCYKGRINGVGLAGNLPSTLIRRLSVQHSIPVILIDNIWTFKDNLPLIDIQYRRKLNVFIIEASSFLNLDTLIYKNIRRTIWWNHMASFFILDLSPGCVYHQKYLYLAWQRNVLNAKVMCRDHKSGRIIFDFNPFTSKSPASWRRVNVFPVNNHRFTVLSPKYQENETICANLDYDKTNDLGGFPIRVKGIRHRNVSESKMDVGRRGVYEFETTRTRMFSIIFRAMNATVKNVPRGYDVNAILGPLEETWAVNKLFTVYPFAQFEVNIITQFRGHKSQLNKILSIIDVDSRFGMGVVYLITLIFLKFFVRQALVPALLNLIRITCNVGFVNLSNDNASRIYLGTVLFFVVTMQGIFQGDLAALLTKQIPVRNVNTIKDLENLGYKEIYGGFGKRRLFDGSVLKKIYNDSIRNVRCVERVRNDSSVACVESFAGLIIDLVRKYELHISRRPIELLYRTFPIRWYWPLEQRVNMIIARMVEADVISSWDVQCNRIKASDFYVDSAVKSNVDFKNIELHEVAFAFVILGIGLVCSSIVFVIELAIYKYRSKNRNRSRKVVLVKVTPASDVH